jgi:glycosyltransferase involved in cell wall biosynthesis
MSWICCQLGAREHYAIPRALFHKGVLVHLTTDAWMRPTSPFALFSRSLRERFHPDLASAPVQAWNVRLVAFELTAKTRSLSGWPLIMARNNWFERKVVNHLARNTEKLKSETVKTELIIFAYSYAAREIFRFAKQRGWKTVLGQIDPGPVEEKIVAEEAARVPELAGDWQPAPAKYWDNWQEECSLADHIIVNSEWSRACLVEAGIGSSKLIVMPLAYELPEVSGQKSASGPEGPTARREVRGQRSAVRNQITNTPITRAYPTRFTPDRPLRVLFLGQVNLRKGVARLFDAIRQLKNEPVEFEFVGRVQVAVPADLKDNARVRWFGAVPRGKTADFYRTADVLIFPTLSDGFGLTQLEAQAHGLPVIASRCCGEVVKHGVNGLLLDEPVADAIVEAFRSCLADPSRLAAFSAASRIDDRFFLDSLAQNLLSLAGA